MIAQIRQVGWTALVNAVLTGEPACLSPHLQILTQTNWAEEAVAKAEILRLIYQGRFLHSNVTLGALGLPFGKTTVMHLVPRENLPEPNSQVIQVIRENWRTAVNEVAVELNISHGSVHSRCATVPQNVCQGVPKQLTPELKERHVVVCETLLQHYEAIGDGFLKRIVTGEKCWVHHFQPGTKRASKDVGTGVAQLAKCVLHLAYSLDLAPSDYHVFGPLKETLGGKKFHNGEVKEMVHEWLHKYKHMTLYEIHVSKIDIEFLIPVRWSMRKMKFKNCEGKNYKKGNPCVLHQRPLHYPKATMWCAVSSSTIIRLYFFEDEDGEAVTVNSQHYRHMLQTFFVPELHEHENLWLQQDGATAHTALTSIAVVHNFSQGI
ncbi:hypothetical protein ANN_21016 [Periplaneta americana]|uniref:UBL3-like ubiquitin domain-containing protein n=1 Tax=Periplaneta americana TaxID=6978 RepID=A0ABQ8SFG8_PERAM|nr:hypothetical protein ANN_21016 [Periplaneta americana]